MTDIVEKQTLPERVGSFINETRLRVLCREGRVKGAKLIGNRWVLPDNFVISPPKKQKVKK